MAVGTGPRVMLTVALMLLATACSSDAGDETTTAVTAETDAPTGNETEATTTTDIGDAPPAGASSGDEPPPVPTTTTTIAPENVQAEGLFDGCDLFGWLRSFDGPDGLTAALIRGELPSNEPAVTAAACHGWESWHSDLVFDGLEEPPNTVTVSSDTVLREGEADTSEVIDLDGRQFEAISIGDVSYWRAPDGEWRVIDFTGDDTESLAALAQFGAEFGELFPAGFIIGFGLIGTLIYAPLAEVVGPESINGIPTTHWRVTPEAASEFAASQGADFPPSAFGDSSIDYWVTEVGGLAQIDLFFDEAAVLLLGGQPGSPSRVHFEISQVDEPLEITAP